MMKTTKSRPILQIKPASTDDPESLRLYMMVCQSVERLNNYVADFYESIQILSENRNACLFRNDRPGAEEISGSIDFMESKIDEVSKSMEAIAHAMPELVVYQG